MNAHPTGTSAIAISAQVKIDHIKNSAFFRFAVFMVSTAAGYLLCYWLVVGLHLIPAFKGAVHASGNPVADFLHMLNYGFGG